MKPLSATLNVQTSVLFRPARTMGVVTDTPPFSLQKLGTADFVTVASGNSYQVYDTEKLRLSYLSPEFNERVRAILTVGETTLTALADAVVVWRKQVEIGRFGPAGVCKNVRQMCNIGGQYVITVDSSGLDCQVWELNADTSASGAGAPTPIGANRILSVATVPTFLNKVLIGTEKGDLILVNVRTLKHVFCFQNHREVEAGSRRSMKKKAGDSESSEEEDSTSAALSADEMNEDNDEDLAQDGAKENKNASSGEDGITCIAACPTVLDVVALGFASGRVLVFHAKKDEVLVEFRQSNGGRIHSLSFRSDKLQKQQQLISASEIGFVVWDLTKKAVSHVEPVLECAKACFLQQQPFLVVQGKNSLYMFVFDTPDGLPRPLRSRKGTTGPIRAMQYYQQDGHELLVACENTVAKISTIQAHQNREFSPAALPEKLPPITTLSFSATRHFDWPAVVTAHRDCRTAYLWSAQYQSLIPKKIERSDKSLSAVTGLTVTACGNWTIVGYADGTLHRFAIQSQQSRGEFSRKGAVVNGQTTRLSAHASSVTCVTVTKELEVISGCSEEKDPYLRVWRQRTQELLGEIRLPTGARFFTRPLGSLLAVALIDGSVAVVDLLSKRVVRHFKGLSSQVLALAFRKDGRWLAVSSVSGKVHVFDLASARCIDVLRFSSPVLSLEFSPNSAYLLTCHPKTARLGAVHVWANKFLFELDHSAPLLRAETDIASVGVEMDTKPSSSAASSSLSSTSPALKKPKYIAEAVGNKTAATIADTTEAMKRLEKEKAGDSDKSSTSVEAWRDAEDISEQKSYDASADSSENLDEKEIEKLFKQLDDVGRQEEDQEDGAVSRGTTELKLSGVPTSKWESILHWEAIKERNKLAQPEKAKKAAPFFLPTTYEGAEAKFLKVTTPDGAEGDEDPFAVAEAAIAAENEKLSSGDLLAGSGLDLKDNSSFFLGGEVGGSSSSTSPATGGAAAASAANKRGNNTKGSTSSSGTASTRLLNFETTSKIGLFNDKNAFSSTLQKLLRRRRDDGGAEKSSTAILDQEILVYLENQTQSGVHLALSELGPLAGGDDEELTQMLDFFRTQLNTGLHADLLQTYLAVFLRKHHADLDHSSDLLLQLSEAQDRTWGIVQAKFQKCISFLRMLTQTQTQW
ncbi:unnamed protein product [Amoebophrya sp. A25]|nr:unnamed protein product [Amoebophrya sp. A25]|eukprot:GSA25T00017670001.1